MRYGSDAEVVVALLGRLMDVIVQNPSDVVPQIRAGQLRLLASASPMRWREFPYVPTIREAGYEVEIASSLGVGVPKGAPREIVARLEATAGRPVRSCGRGADRRVTGADPEALPASQYEALLANDSEAVAPMLRRAGLAKP